MSEQINDGGAAFPQPQQFEELTPAGGGMSLRDYFAAKAMQGELAAQEGNAGFYSNLDALAALSYRIADAMLKARSGGGK